MKNDSPWIKQLLHHNYEKLNENVTTDVVVVGAGVAGVSTAYEILTKTDKKVVLIEANKVGHGATGHNAGQLTSYFERPYHSIVDEFGPEMASYSQKEVYNSWGRIEKILEDTKIKVPLFSFDGYAGVSTFEQLIEHLENKLLRRTTGLVIEKVFVADSFNLKKIDDKYNGLWETIGEEEIKEKLNTNSDIFIGLLTTRKGVMNSSLFSEALVKWMTINHKDRFKIYTDTKITEIILDKDSAVLKTGVFLSFVLKCKKVVLCTNGFENFTIKNMANENINKKFHEFVHGRVAYMIAHLSEHDPEKAIAMATSYFPKNYSSGNLDEADYFYLTHRPYELTVDSKDQLIAMGGPTQHISAKSNYNKDTHTMSMMMEKRIDKGLKDYYKFDIKHSKYKFRWHGLMGYTNNLLRLVGEDKINPVLMYNLGCNGVGIMASLFGAERIAKIINKEKLKPTIFDTK